jgi:hypothetical protein
MQLRGAEVRAVQASLAATYAEIWASAVWPRSIAAGRMAVLFTFD